MAPRPFVNPKSVQENAFNVLYVIYLIAQFPFPYYINTKIDNSSCRPENRNAFTQQRVVLTALHWMQISFYFVFITKKLKVCVCVK